MAKFNDVITPHRKPPPHLLRFNVLQKSVKTADSYEPLRDLAPKIKVKKFHRWICMFSMLGNSSKPTLPNGGWIAIYHGRIRTTSPKRCPPHKKKVRPY